MTASAASPARMASGCGLQPPGNDLTRRFTRIVEAVARLKARTCIIDGEAVACGPDGIALFDLIRYRRHDESVFLRAFDIIELNGDDLRRETLESRKATLAIALAGTSSGIELNEHLEHDDGGLCFNMPATRLRGHHLEAQRFALCVRPFAALDENEKSAWRCCDAGGQGGVGALSLCPQRAALELALALSPQRLGDQLGSEIAQHSPIDGAGQPGDAVGNAGGDHTGLWLFKATLAAMASLGISHQT